VKTIQNILIDWIKSIFGYCSQCNKWFKYPFKSHIGTMYVNEEDNYRTICKDCHSYIGQIVESQWDEYHNERGC
jgi:hypothetical protein